MTHNATQCLVFDGAEPAKQLTIDRYLLGGHFQFGDKDKAVGQFTQQTFGQITHESLQHIGHIVLVVLVACDLHIEGIRTERAYQLVHGVLRSGLAVNALRHGAVYVHKVDALVHYDGHIVARQLLIPQREAIVVRHLAYDVSPDLCFAGRPHDHVDRIRWTVDHQHGAALHMQIVNGIVALL